MSGLRTKLLAFSDLHLGITGGHRRDPLGDHEDVLTRIASAAMEHEVDLVLFAGDAFHFWKPTPAELHIFRRFTRALDDAGIPMVAVTGNQPHDIGNGDLPCALELFRSPMVHVSRKPEVVAKYGLAVCTLPSVPVSRLSIALEGRDRGEVNEIAAGLLVEQAAELRASVDGPAVLLGHWSVSGSALPSGLPVTDLHEPVLSIDALDDLRFDAMVFGHIHRGQIVGRANGFYCGSPLTLNFGEADQHHGFWLVDVGDALPLQFVALPGRRFVSVNVDMTEGGDWTQRQADSPRSEKDGSAPGLPDEGREADARVNGYPVAMTAAVPGAASSHLDETDVIASAIAEQFAEDSLADAVVRVAYTATEDQHRRVDQQALIRLVYDAGAHQLHGEIKWNPVQVSRARVEVDESFDPLEAVAAWAIENGTGEDVGYALCDLTSGYLETLA